MLIGRELDEELEFLCCGMLVSVGTGSVGGLGCFSLGCGCICEGG